MMGSEEAEPDEPSSTLLKLPLQFPFPAMESPDRSGTVTPPLYSTSASVPFGWEEEPGKPRPITALILHRQPNKVLDPPPRLFTKIPSPTTVLDGPYTTKSSTVSQSSSFRFFREREEWSSSLGSSSRRSLMNITTSPDDRDGQQLGSSSSMGRGFFGGLGRRPIKVKGSRCGIIKSNNSGGAGGSFVFLNSGEDMEANCCNGNHHGGGGVKMTRNGSSSSLSRASSSHFWSAIYKGFKQVIPWSRKSKKEGLII